MVPSMVGWRKGMTYNLYDYWLIQDAKTRSILVMEDPLKPPVPDDPPEPQPKPGRKTRIVCDFCECELAADGGVLKTSERAKQLERADKEITDLQGRLETKQAELEALKAPKDPPTPPNGGEPPQPKKESFIRW